MEEKIKEKVKEFFEKLEEPIEIKEVKREDLTFFVKIESKSNLDLIGENGKTLYAIQHILKCILRREIPENFYIDLDINSFKEKRKKYLIEMARKYADEVSLLKREIILEPLSAQERRIIHLELAKRNDVATFSIGQGENRRIVIKPYP